MLIKVLHRWRLEISQRSAGGNTTDSSGKLDESRQPGDDASAVASIDKPEVVKEISKEESARIKLLRFSYDEILDATKHQDDKINRLLTTIAFLTAAALAFANLGAAKPLSTWFDLGDVDVPLSQYLLGIFLVGVVATVVMLVASLSTPLRFPGSASPKEGLYERSTADFDEVDKKFSQIYFHEIAKMPLLKWEQYWQKSATDLRREQEEQFVRETHNLALRTEYKYARTNEAVAVMSFALLSFALASVLVLVALGRPEGAPVEMTIGVRLIVGLVLAGYCIMAVLTSVRSASQSVQQLESVRFQMGNIRKASARVVFVLTASSAPALFVLMDFGRVDFSMTVLGLCPLVALVSLAIFLRTGLGPDSERSIKAGMQYWGFILAGGQIVFAIFFIVGFNYFSEPYLVQLILALGTPVLLVSATLLRSAMDQRVIVGRYIASKSAPGRSGPNLR